MSIDNTTNVIVWLYDDKIHHRYTGEKVNV